MKKSFRGIVLILIALVALASSVLSIYSLGKEVFELMQTTTDFQTSVIYLLLTQGIDIIFAIVELSFGFQLIKAVKNNDHFDTYKMTSGLVTTIVYSQFTLFLIEIIFTFISSQPLENLDVVFIVLFFIITTLTSFIRPIVLRRKLLALDAVMLTISSLALVLFVMSLNMEFILSEAISLASLSDILNCVMLLMLVIFSLFSFVYYLKNPEACILEERENEDVDILETFEKYEKVKLYSYRGVDNKNTRAAIILSIIGSILCVAFAVLYFIENKFHETFIEQINAIVGMFKGTANISLDFTYYFVTVLVPIFAFFAGLNYLFGVITKNAQYKVYNIQIMQVASLFLTFILYSRLFSIGFAYVYGNFSLSMLSIFDAILLITDILNSIVRRVFKNTIKSISDSIKNGDTYHDIVGKVARVNIAYGLVGILSTGLCGYYEYYKHGNIWYSLVLMIFVIILINIGTCIEKKHPASEYLIIKRKRMDKKVETNIKTPAK